MARNNPSTAHVTITMDGAQAVHTMNMMREKVKELRDQLEQMENSGQIDTDDYKEAAKDLKSYETMVRQNARAYLDLDRITKNLSKYGLRDLRMALKETKKQMEALNPEELARQGKNFQREMARLQSQYTAIDNQIGRITGQWQRQDGAIMSVIKRLTAYVSVYGGFNFVTGKLKHVFDSNLEFSDQLADIRKATGLSVVSVRELSDEIMKMDTRSAVSELHKLAYEAGRLGIGNMGADAVLGFVRAADKLNVALKEDLGDDAILQLTKIADVMGLTQKMGVEKALTSIGSAINELAQNSTASGSFMTDYVSRLSGVAVQAHLTIDELLALAAASDATGQEVEVSATAMNKFVTQLQTHYKTVAKAAGISEESLHSMLEAGHTMEAVIAVLEALGQKGGLSMLAPLMKDMGSDGARLTASLSTMASNINLVKAQLDLSTDAFEKNISVTNEFNIRNQTAAAIMQRMKNSWEKMFTNSENEGEIKQITEDLYELSNMLQQNQLFLGTVSAAFAALTGVVKALIAMTPYLALFFSIKGMTMFVRTVWNSVIPAVKAIRDGMLAARMASEGAAGAATRAGRAFASLKVALSSNVFLLVASAVSALIAHLYTASTKLSDFEESMQSFERGVEKFGKTSHAAGIEANTLFARLKEAKDSAKERAELILQINKEYGKYLPNLLNEKSTLEEIATAQETVNTKLRQALALKAKNNAMDEVSQQYMPKMADATSRIQEIYTKEGLSAVGNSDVRYLVEETQRLYDAGKTYEEIKTKIWDDLYRVDKQTGHKGRSSHLLETQKGGEAGPLLAHYQSLQGAIENYVRNFWNQNVMINQIAKKYDPIIKGYKEDDSNGAPFRIEEAQTDTEVRKANREALNDAKDEYQAVMAALKVFYTQQEQVVNDAYMNREITISQREQQLFDIEQRYLESRIKARAALHDDPGAEGEWYEELNRMAKESISNTKEHDRALKNLLDKDLKEIGDKLRKFGEGEDDGIWKKLEEDKAKWQENLIKMQQDVEKILRQYDFTQQVTEQFIGSMQKLDLFAPQLKEKIRAMSGDAQEEVEKLMKTFHSLYPKLFSIDIGSEEGINAFANLLQNTEGLGADYSKMNVEGLVKLYNQIMDYGDAMTEAQTKEDRRSVRIGKAQYKQTDKWKNNENAVKKEEETVKMYELAQQLGLASDIMVQDQEVKMYEARLKAAQDYYLFLKTTGRDTKEAEQQLEAASAELATAMVAQVKEKMDLLRGYGKNLEDFGTDFGEAIFGDTEAKQKALEKFVRSLGKTTQELILNWLKQKIEHALIRRAMVKTEEDAQKKMTDESEKGQENTEKTIKKAGQKLGKELARSAKKRLQTKKEDSKEEANIEKESQDTQVGLATAGQQLTQKVTADIGAQTLATQKSQAAESVNTQAAETQAGASLGIAEGAAKTIGKLGWWGIPLVAVITAVINGLLSMAMGKVGSLFGGGDKQVDQVKSAIPQKLVSGMLTYDSGNVQTVLGNDGRIYQAHVGGINGSGLVTVPTLTNVNGQPALVGEQGPEIVIGRATTRAMRENAPELLSSLVSFDRMVSGRSFRTYDDGNVQEMGMSGGRRNSEEEIYRIASAVAATLAPTLQGISAELNNNAQSNEALRVRLNQPIQAVINKNGRGGLIEEVASGLAEERRTGRNENVRRLFGKR